MRVVLVRHGVRAREGPDKEAQLTEHGREQVKTLATALASFGLKPDVFLLSTHQHARETVSLLKEQLPASGSAAEVPLEALTPGKENVSGLGEVILQATKQGVPLEHLDTVVVVGHDPRLSQLLTALTSLRLRPLLRGEAVSVVAPSLIKLRQGRGEVEFRHPVADYQESNLRDKIHSKVVLSTFLAGFVFASLVQLLGHPALNSDSDGELSTKVLAAIALSVALAFLVGAIYAFDALGMPEGFWANGDRSRMQRIVSRKREQKREAKWKEALGSDEGVREARLLEEEWSLNGALYYQMMRAWKALFRPGILAASVGYVLLVLDVDNNYVRVGGLAGLALGTFVYLWARPDLGVD